MKPNMKPNQVLVIDIQSVTRQKRVTLFDAYGLLKDRDYLFFPDAGEEVLKQVEPGLRQLVLMSHGEGIDSTAVADEINKKNPKAVIFAFSKTRFKQDHDSCLDGVIIVSEMDETDPQNLVKEFIEGVAHKDIRDYLIEVVQEI